MKRKRRLPIHAPIVWKGKIRAHDAPNGNFWPVLAAHQLDPIKKRFVSFCFLFSFISFFPAGWGLDDLWIIGIICASIIMMSLCAIHEERPAR